MMIHSMKRSWVDVEKFLKEPGGERNSKSWEGQNKWRRVGLAPDILLITGKKRTQKNRNIIYLSLLKDPPPWVQKRLSSTCPIRVTNTINNVVDSDEPVLPPPLSSTCTVKISGNLYIRGLTNWITFMF